MKQTFTILYLCLVLLLSDCAPKQTFMFSNFPAGQGVKQKVQPETIAMPKASACTEENSEFSGVTDSILLTASTAPLPLGKVITTPKKVLPVDFKATAPNKTPKSKLLVSPAKVLKLQKAIHKQLKARLDDGSKSVNKFALVGFLLGLGAVGLVLLQAFSPTSPLLLLSLLAAIGGLITSSIGSKEINKNPDRYVGKGKAIAGIVLSLGVLVFLLISFISVLVLFSSLY